MKVIAIYNIKGGVGKTACAVNLAYFCAKEGIKTLIWDLDAQGASTYYFKVKPGVKGGTKKLFKSKELGEFVKETEIPFLDLLPADFSYRNMDLILDDAKRSKKRVSELLDGVKEEYDAVFLDAPPNISLVSENIFNAATHILIPVIPTTLSLRTYEQILHYFESEGIKGVTLLPFFSMVDRRKNLHKQIVRDSGISQTLNNLIPYSSVIEQMGIHQAPVDLFAPNSAAARAYGELWEEVKMECGFAHLATLPKIFGKKGVS